MFTRPLVQIKLHLLSLTQWISKLRGSFEIHLVRQNLVYFTGLADIVNVTVYKTKPISTDRGRGKLSWYLIIYISFWNIFNEAHGRQNLSISKLRWSSQNINWNIIGLVLSPVIKTDNITDTNTARKLCVYPWNCVHYQSSIPYESTTTLSSLPYGNSFT